MRLASFVFLGSVLASACEGGKGGAFPDGGNGSGEECGGFAGRPCAADQFCDFGRDTCGASDETGTCRPRPLGCPDVFDPVCGCDGTVHGNGCDANAAGVDVDANGNCAPQIGSFACGFRFCDLATEYCQRATSDIGGEPDAFSCRPIPGSCSVNPSCACLVTAGEPCADLFCEGDAAGGLQVTCPGG